jgi:hypothetical protein
LAITAAGNVGIGTTAPTSNLEVVNTTSASIAVRSGTNTYDGCYIVGAGQYESVYDARVSGNASGSRVIRFGNVNGGNFTFRALADTGETVLRTPVSISNTAPTGSLYILSSGNVGIGTTAPSSKLHVEGSIAIAAAQALSWVGRAAIQSPGVGIFQISDTSGADVNRLSFGHNNLNSPALKRVGTELQVVQAGTTAASNFAAGDADLTFIEDRFRRKGAGSPEGVVTAPIGAVYHNTTGGAGTSFYVKESGTGNTGWVGK